MTSKKRNQQPYEQLPLFECVHRWEERELIGYLNGPTVQYERCKQCGLRREQPAQKGQVG